MTPAELHVVVPGSLDQPTGGYRYDARMVEGLRRSGWRVSVHELGGTFPADEDPSAGPRLERLLARIPSGARVVIDGLALGALPEPAGEHAHRLRILALVHHPLADETGLTEPRRARLAELERAALASCTGVICTSAFTAKRLEAFDVPPERIRSVPPGTDPAPLAEGPRPGAPPLLLSVAAVVPRKGHDVLVGALERVRHLAWRLECAGSIERDPAYARKVLGLVRRAGLEGRVRLRGAVSDAELDALYRQSSLFVLASYFEGYGMALTEALARGIPIVAATGGAVPHTVPEGAGVLVPPGDPEALAEALTPLLEEGEEGAARREALAASARRHGERLPDWKEASRAFARAVLELAPEASAPERKRPFGADWLALREPVDHRSRSPALLAPLREAWQERGWSRVLDLGCGTGSNLRYLVPRLPGGQEWTLLDDDHHLLSRVRLPDRAPVIASVRGDLAREGLEAVAGTDLVTASALLDLVSEEWFARLVVRCRAEAAGALFALTYDGRIRWEGTGGGGGSGAEPELEADERLVYDAVNAHQRGDKGLGPALGSDGARVAERLFRQEGYRTWLLPSAWRLDAGDEALTLALIEGWEEAALEERPGEAPRIERWAARRRETVRRGSFRLAVGHLDLLALPPPA